MESHRHWCFTTRFRHQPLETFCCTHRPERSSTTYFVFAWNFCIKLEPHQLTVSSSAWAPALLVYKCSSSVLRASSLLLIALACLGWTRYCYCHAAANFLHSLLLILVVFVFFCIFVLYLNRLYTRIFSRYKCHHDTHTNGCEATNVIIAYTYK